MTRLIGGGVGTMRRVSPDFNLRMLGRAKTRGLTSIQPRKIKFFILFSLSMAPRLA